MSLDRGRRFVVVHPCSTFSDCRQMSTSLNAEVQKGHLGQSTDKINRSRRNLAFKSIPWVCYITSNYFGLHRLKGSAHRTGAPQMSKFAQNCSFWPPGADTICICFISQECSTVTQHNTPLHTTKTVHSKNKQR